MNSLHELTIIDNIIRICVDEAKKHKVSKILEIKIKIGELSGMVPEYIQYYFDIISKGTAAEKALLKIEKIPIEIKCNDCDMNSEVSLDNLICLYCRSANVQIIKGNGFIIESMEVE